jgi:hypothetical protein
MLKISLVLSLYPFYPFLSLFPLPSSPLLFSTPTVRTVNAAVATIVTGSEAAEITSKICFQSQKKKKKNRKNRKNRKIEKSKNLTIEKATIMRKIKIPSRKRLKEGE